MSSLSGPTRLLLFIAGAYVSACSSSRTASSADERARGEQDRARLIAQLQQQLTAAAHVHLRIDPSAVHFRVDSSKAIPGLTYQWAWYQAPGYSHGLAFAVLGRNGDAARIIRDQRDWSALADSWTPRNDSAALTACMEVGQVAGRARGPDPVSVPLQSAADEIEAMPDELRSRIAAVQKESGIVRAPQSPDLGWTAELWLFETQQTTRYRCTFPTKHVSNGDTVRVEELRTIPGVGWYFLRIGSSDSG
jgi:hypothetical protein